MKTPRRRVIATLGMVSVAALAGCTTTEQEDSDVTSAGPAVSKTPEETDTASTPSEEQTQPSLRYQAEVPDSSVAGQSGQIAITVENNGEMEAHRTLQLKFAGSVIDTETIKVEPQSEETHQFEFRTFRLGPSEVTINDTQLGSISVTPFGQAVEERSINQKLGATHTASKYRFQEGDLLNEGAEVLQHLGSRLIKTWFHRTDAQYPFTEWPEFESMVEIASHRHYQELFNRSFDTYVLVAYAHTQARETGGSGYFVHEISESAEREEEESFYELTKYLLQEYDGTGKEFLLQNWEGDWILAGEAGGDGPLDPEVLERGKRWWNARQRGIARARQEIESDAAVLGVCEINRVRQAMEEGEQWIVNSILGDLETDLVSYSSWDLCSYLKNQPTLNETARQEVQNTLDYINEHAPSRSDYLKAALGPEAKPVFIGEFGAPLRETSPSGAMRAVRGITEESLSWGAPYVLFWQTYDNEVYIDGKKIIVDPNIEAKLESAFGGYAGVDDVRGFYLIRPDGRRSPVWFYYADHLGTNQDEFVKVELRYDSVRLESEINPDVSAEHARKLAVGCEQIEVEFEHESVTFDIGSSGGEVVFVDGMYPREEKDQFTFRWFGGGGKRTVFYIPYSRNRITGTPSALRFKAWGVEGGTEADILVDGAKAGHIAFEDSREMHVLELNI